MLLLSGALQRLLRDEYRTLYLNVGLRAFGLDVALQKEALHFTLPRLQHYSV